MQLLRNVILVTLDAPETTTKSGLHFVEKDSQAPLTGVVTHIGPKVTELVVGDHVTFNRYAGNDIVVEEVPHRMLLETDVMYKKV